jgi:NTP pyrophosphatase (non-canonical NTP hydrolase)
MKFQEAQELALQVRRLYDKYNRKSGNKPWGTTDLMSGFVGDVGDLSKIIMAKNGFREIDDADRKLAHELSDCLWCVFVLADKFKIDLESEFQKTMSELEQRIADN